MSTPWAVSSGVVRASDGRSWVRPGVTSAAMDYVGARVARVERPAALALEAAAAVWPEPPADPPARLAGVALGTMLGCLATNAEYQTRLARHGTSAASPRLFASTVSNAAAGEVGIAYGLGGPALTVTAGMAGGLAALETALGEMRDAAVERMVVLAVDVIDAAGRRWLQEMRWQPSGPDEQVAALTIGAGDGVAAPIAFVEAAECGYDPGRDGRGVVAVARRALARATRRADEVAMLCVRGPVGEAVAAGLGVTETRVLPELAVGLGAAGGIAALLLAGGSRARPTLVIDVCPSGHVAACVAWSCAS